VTEKGTLCGSGDISIESFPGPGDDDGRGGVVVLSACSMLAMTFTIQKDNRTPTTECTKKIG